MKRPARSSTACPTRIGNPGTSPRPRRKNSRPSPKPPSAPIRNNRQRRAQTSMTVLVTGAAGFIGSHVSRALLAQGRTVIGVDDLNGYYDVRLKQARLALLEKDSRFAFHRLDIAARDAGLKLVSAHPEIERIVHLAAQAGVRYSLANPYAYTRSNVEGQIVMLEAARALPALRHFVYASSSSVDRGN